MGKREDPIQKAIIEYLRLQYPRCVIAHVANEVSAKGKAISIAIAGAKRLGMLPGFPDLICVWQGRIWFFEVKAPGGRLSEAQESVRDALLANLACYAVVRSIEDVQRAIGGFEAILANGGSIGIRGTINGGE